MTTRYVWSGATGANDGTSWADAYTSIASVSPNDGDLVLVAPDHSETPGDSLGGTRIDEGVRWISANRSTDAYESGA